jgi:hypothetical protein
VYDVLGNEIAILIDEEKPAGDYEVEFNANSLPAVKKDLSSGIYFYQINVYTPGQAGSFVAAKKMILLK